MMDSNPGRSPLEPRPVFVDADIRVFEGAAAAEKLRARNDLPYLTEKGIVRVDRSRWQEAQRYERKTWMENLVDAKDDRNHDHKDGFAGYQAIAGRKFRRVLELGCGPFTNLRLVLEHIPAPDHITLLDPLIRDYLTHPHCTYRDGSLKGIRVEPVASSIEEFNPSEPYDLVVMANVLEHCFDVPLIFERILQCLKPGGVLVFGDNVFRPDELPKILAAQFDAGHPIRVVESLVEGFLRENFCDLHFRRIRGQYDQPHRIDLYFVGVRDPLRLVGGEVRPDVDALLAIDGDDVAERVFESTQRRLPWDGRIVLETAATALKRGRVALAEFLAAKAADLMPGSVEATALRQRITNFKNTFWVTVGQILPDSPMGLALRRVIGRFRPKSILDLGAASGLGSTTVLAQAVAEHRLDARIYAVESAPHTFEQLRANVARFPHVTPLHGSVVDADALPTWAAVLASVRSRPNHVLEHITEEELEHWYEHTRAETETIWRTRGSVLRSVPEQLFDLVIIDADLFFGSEALDAVIDKANIIVLDDVAEHKNAATHELLSSNRDWERLEGDLADRHGWSMFRRRVPLGQPVAAGGKPSSSPRIHFAYSGDPRNDSALRAPATITNRIFRFLEQRAEVICYDFADTTTVPDVRPGDVVLGHPHPNPDTIMHRLFQAGTAGKHLVFPFHSRLPEINRFAKTLAGEAGKLFLISGPYWTDGIGGTEYADWKDRIVRLDNAIDLDFFALRKKIFNPEGRRGLFVLGRSGPEKGTTELFRLLREAPGPLFVAGEFNESDLALLRDRPETEFIGVLDWRNEPLVQRVVGACDFFVNFSVSDASPTTLFEAMALGLVPVTTPQCGYTYPSLIPLSLADTEHDRITLRNLQTLPSEQLQALQDRNRELVEQNHNWPRFLEALWRGLTDAPETKPVVVAPARAPKRVKIAVDYSDKLDLTQIDGESEFAAAIRRIFAEVKPRKIVETGTYFGEGTTRVIADTLRQLGLDEAEFHSIEINPSHLDRARQNLTRDGLIGRVRLHHGVSVPRGLLPSLDEIERATVRDIEEDDIFVDHREHDRASLYFKETDFHGIPDDLLGRVLRGFQGRPDFVLLDSGGHMGNVEFNYLLEQLEGSCWIALDDVHHIKHRQSLRQMQRDRRFEIVVNSTEKFGFCIARFNPAKVAVEPAIERVLIVRTDSIGDAVLASSMLPHLAAKYPAAKLAVLCDHLVADFYLACPYVESVIAFDRTKASDDDHLRGIIGEIAGFKPQIIFNSVRSRDVLSETLTLAFRSAMHIAVEGDLANMSEVDRDEAQRMYHRVIPSSGVNKPELERHRDFLAGLDIDVPSLQPKVWTSDENEAVADEFFRQNGLDPEKTIAVFPGAQHGCRVYSGYAEALAGIEGHDFLVFGTAGEEALAESMVGKLPGRVLNLCGRSSLRETIALLRRCRMYVGAESAGAHMACAVGVPNVVLLGGGHFGRFMPYSPLTAAVSLPMDCFGCNWRCRHEREHCAKDVPASVIAEAIRVTLKGISSLPRIFVPAETIQGDAGRARIEQMETLLGGTKVELCPTGHNGSAIQRPSEAAPRGLDAHLVQLEKALAAGDMVTAEKVLRKAHNEFPQEAELATALANLQFQRGHFEDAIPTFKAVCGLKPQDPALPVLLAHCCMKIEDSEGVEEAIRLAFKVQPGNPLAIRFLADMNVKLGRHREAAHGYGQLIQGGSTDVEVMLALGVCFQAIGDKNGAVACFTEVVRQQPAHTEANRRLAELSPKPAVSSQSAAQTQSRMDHEKVACPKCGSHAAQPVRDRADIVQCGACQIVYLRTRLTKEAMRKLYQTYADGGSHMALPNSLAEAEGSGLARDYFLGEILEFVEPEGGFLDVGCGWGGFLLNARKKGFEPRGIELTRKCVGYANEQLGIPVLDTQLEETDIALGSLSVVSMNHVLEHLPEPRQALKKVIDSLRPGGMYCGMVPNFASACSSAQTENWYWLDPFYHYTHFTPATLRRTLEEAGFSVERIYTATGDYGAENVRKACLPVDPKLADNDYFASEIKRYEADGRGEEIRFFARKPAATVPAGQDSANAAEYLLVDPANRAADPVVSVVVSTYAAEHLIRACLTNLARQTIFDRCEVIVVDSGSPGNERAIVAEFQAKHPNIRYLRTHRETLYAAWNRGLEIALGRYWVNANTDDALRDDALEVMVAAMEKNQDCALAYGDTAWTSVPNDTFPSKNILQTVKYAPYAPVDTLFYCVTGCLQFWRSETLRGLGGFDATLKFAGDYEATLKLLRAGLNAVHVAEVLSLFFQNTTGLTQSSDGAEAEHERLMNAARLSLDVGRVFQVVVGNPESEADAWAALGFRAKEFTVPWESQKFGHGGFALECFRKGLAVSGSHEKSGMNLVRMLQKLDRLGSDEAPLVRDFPDAGQWIARTRSGEGFAWVDVSHAVSGRVYRPGEWTSRPTPEQLSREPEALRSWIARIEGRHVYLSEDLFPHPAGLRYTPEEHERIVMRLATLLRDLPGFYAHFGGAGDALLLMASLYDQKPGAVVFSYPNSVGSTRSFFDGFPNIGRIYFLQAHTEAYFHVILRYAIRVLRNCLGAGATPREGYEEEWKPGLDLTRRYGINKTPRWAAAMRNNLGSRRVAVAPQGSMAGMVGSKRNIIDPAIWPQVVAHIVGRGFEPVILGLPSEAKNYPALPGCKDERGSSFAAQMESIGGSAGLVGADSWGKTFSALAAIPTLVFEPLKGPDLIGWKDPADWVFIEPWPAIRMVGSFESFQTAFDANIAGLGTGPETRKVSRPVVSWEGSFLDYGSLSNINRELTRHLADDNSFRLTCVATQEIAPGAGSDPAMKKLAKSVSRTAPKNPSVTIRHQWPPDWSRPAEGKLVVIQPWEYGSLPQAWVDQSGNVDEFWVPSRVVRHMYLCSGIAPEKVRVLPNGVDCRKYRPGLSPIVLATRKKFKFLFVGGTIHRKGPDILLEAFLRAFKASDDVCLVIKDFGAGSVYRDQTAADMISAARRRPDAPEIVHLTEELPAERMPSLYAACDCLVHPYRGEGFGMPVLEAMACGLPVVVTEGGSTADFVGIDAGWFIPAREKKLGRTIGDIRLCGEGVLLEPSVSHLAGLMTAVAGNLAGCRKRGAAGRGIVERRFDWSDIAAMASFYVKDLLRGTDRGPEVPAADSVVSKAAVAMPAAVAPKSVARKFEVPKAALVGHIGDAREALSGRKFRMAWDLTCAAIPVRPFHPEGWLLLGQIALEAGDTKLAGQCLDRVKALAPQWKPGKDLAKMIQKRGSKKSLDWPLPDVSDKPRLTVCLIAKNEERFLGQCLASVKDLADEIVVVDTGSTDRTVEIARSFGAKLGYFEWSHDFSAARNAALELATGDWILVLDADEELMPEHKATIHAEMAEAGTMAWRLPLINVGKEADGVSHVPRLFRNAPALFYVGRVHEQVFTSIEVRRAEWGLDNKLGKTRLLHHGYTEELTRDRNKVERNLRLLEEAMKEIPGDANLTFNHGLELVRSGKLEAGLARYSEAAELLGAQAADQIVPELREVILTQWLAILKDAGRFEDLLAIRHQPLMAKGPLSPSMHYMLGFAALRTGDLELSVRELEACLAARDVPGLTPMHRDLQTCAPEHCLALARVAAKQPAAARDAFALALQRSPGAKPVTMDFARFEAGEGDYGRALTLIYEVVQTSPDDVAAWRLGAAIALNRPEVLEVALDWTGSAREQHPDDEELKARRAEALLLAGRSAEALPLFAALGTETSASNRAALLVCRWVAVDGFRPSPADVADLNQAFLQWYRRLVDWNSAGVVQSLNARMDDIARVLPGAASFLQSVLADLGA